jgi:hypothetical protein
MKPNEELITVKKSSSPILSINKNSSFRYISSKSSLKPYLKRTLYIETPRYQWIAEAAFFIAKSRDFIPGHELDDWLYAENEYNKKLVELFVDAAKEDGAITLTGLKQLAKAMGLKKYENLLSKTELIHRIQTACGKSSCFQSNPGEYCSQHNDCLWHSECNKLVAFWCR